MSVALEFARHPGISATGGRVFASAPASLQCLTALLQAGLPNQGLSLSQGFYTSFSACSLWNSA
eukprot:9343844-Prorocentrum_lima.AAC.1